MTSRNTRHNVNLRWKSSILHGNTTKYLSQLTEGCSYVIVNKFSFS